MSTAEGFEEFVTIVESGSVTAASAALGMPRPTLSRRLARLEERLGVRLLRRSTRRLTLTEHGEALYARARRVVAAAREAEAEVRRLDGVPRGLLRVSVPTEMPQGLLSQWLIDFLDACPEVHLEVIATAEHADLVASGIDVALWAGVDDPSVIVRTLANDPWVAVASPRYLAARGTPDSPAALAGHNCIVGFGPQGTPESRWPLRDGGWVPVSGTLAVNQMGVRIQAARRHLGITLATDRVVAGELQRGELAVVLPGVLGRRERLGLVYAEREHLDPKVRAFVDFIAERIAEVRARRPL